MPILKKPKIFHWTSHSRAKMRFYGLSEARLRRVIRSPHRIEEGIAPDTVAMMQSAGSAKHPYEIWLMIQETWINADLTRNNAEKRTRQRKSALSPRKSAVIKVISAWRYPGKTKPGQSLPAEILREMRNFL
ncbi:MAG: hypothetical protein HY433_02585 [Candidatus Liptonbacteria bacterium]|nr:hypothetical protein [Candidatus Liptonbacteria bacterium]